MNHRNTVLFASAAALSLAAGSAFAQTAAPAAPAPAAAAPAPPAPPSLAPSMTAPLAGNSSPMSFDLGPFGNKVYITGALTGIGMVQSNPIPGDHTGQVDLTNAQLLINKADGVVQYFVDVGTYSLPTLGTGYVKAANLPGLTFDNVPVAYLKLVPNASWSVQVGKLPTLLGSEYTFTYENSNIERGLLWAQEPVFSRGVQVNYATGPLALSLSVNDGLYSGSLTSVSGAATWTVDPTDTLIFSASGNTKKQATNTFVTTPFQNNQQIFNVIYTHTQGPWSFTPYFQYTSVPALKDFGTKSADTYGVALLGAYTFDSKSPLAGFSVPFRVEYLSSSGSKKDATNPNLTFFGPGSSAYSFTITPTYQYKIWFVRGELSYTDVTGSAPGFEFGSNFDKTSQVRGLIETGVLF